MGQFFFLDQVSPSSLAIYILLISFSSILILFPIIIKETGKRNGIHIMWMLLKF